MVNIAYFNDGPLLPIKEGGAEKIVNLLRFENIEGKSRVTLFECERQWTNIELLANEMFNSIILNEDTFYHNLSKLNSILKSNSIQGCMFTNPETLLNIGGKLKSLGYKIIYDCHNVFSLYEKRIGKALEETDLLLFKEYAVGQMADLILPCSKVDLQELEKIGVPKNKMKIVENGVDTKKIKYVGSNINNKCILFLGNIYYQPNANALSIICQQISTSSELKGYKFLIAGSVPSDIKLKYEKSNIQFLGYVENLNTIFSEATVALAPLFEGSGTRLKILNYLSAGIPTISTNMGIEGLNVTEKEIVLSDKISDYPKLINTIVNTSQWEDLGKYGRKKVESYYDWRVISKKAVKYYNEIIKHEN